MNEKLLHLANSLVAVLARLGNVIEGDEFCDRCSDEVLDQLWSDLEFISERAEDLYEQVDAEIRDRKKYEGEE